MDRKGALWGHVNPIILLVIDPCSNPLRPGLLLHPYGWLTRQLQLAAQVPYASFRNFKESSNSTPRAGRRITCNIILAGVPSLSQRNFPRFISSIAKWQW